ncbi:hypothetical protein CERSUDRAFT_43711, partial [Gelatoporia subvermispora B]
STVHDLLYIANISVGGRSYPVQLDTGSADLWIKGSTFPLPNTTQTSTTVNMTYGIGWAFGNISYASADFAGITIPTQAYLDVSQASNPALSYGADGILGLGFTSLSTVDSLVNRTGASNGRSLLYNVFAENPQEPNFIAFSLQSTSNPGDDVPGIFSIGETEPQYASVMNSTALPTWPPSYPIRWNVLLDAVLVGGSTVPVSSVVVGAPSGKAVVMLDSGTSYTYAPEDVCNAIYGGIPGAQYDASLGQWTVPCDAEVDMALQFGGNVYPIHPLDVTPTSLSDPNSCVGSFIPQAVTVGAGDFDWLVGDNVLRSVYAIYDFGDFDSNMYMGDPYVKLLSLVDPDKASEEFHQIRGGAPNTNITYNAANTTSSSGSTVISVSDELADTLNKIGTYFPAILAIMALNALVLLVLAGAAITYLCRRRTKAARKRQTPGRSSPMPMNPTSSYGLPSGHAYQPVSMALTEDTFVPPSPAFSKPGFDANPLQPGARPKSVA